MGARGGDSDRDPHAATLTSFQNVSLFLAELIDAHTRGAICSGWARPYARVAWRDDMLARKAGKVVVRVAAIGIFAVLYAPQGRADGGARKIEARLTGFQEVPANLSPGQARFEATVEGDHINFKMTYANLTGDPAASHIHLGQPGVNGGVFTFLCGGGSKPACPPTPATIEGTITAADILALPTQNLAAGDLQAALRAIRSGVTYVNIHTANSPGGEIRGRVRPDFNL